MSAAMVKVDQSLNQDSPVPYVGRRYKKSLLKRFMLDVAAMRTFSPSGKLTLNYAYNTLAIVKEILARLPEIEWTTMAQRTSPHMAHRSRLYPGFLRYTG
jgi:hypothetical protein